jgi:hypothetical protein
MPDLEVEKVSQSEFSRLCGVSEQAISASVRNGTLQKEPDGKLVLGPTLRAYIAARRTDLRITRDSEMAAARLRNMTAKVELERLRLVRLLAETHPSLRVEEEYKDLQKLITDVLHDLPTQVADAVEGMDKPAAIVDIITGLVHAKLKEIQKA